MNKVLYGVLGVLMLVIVFELGYLILYKPTSQSAPTLPQKAAKLSDKRFAKGLEKLEEIVTSYNSTFAV